MNTEQEDISDKKNTKENVNVYNQLGNYTKNTLLKDEIPLYCTHVTWITILSSSIHIFFGILFICIPIGLFGEHFFHTHGLWLVLLLPPLHLIDPFLAYKTSELVITNKRVIIKVGYLQRRTVEMFISKIESVSVDQPFFGRSLNFGTVSIHGTGGTQETFANIENPLEFRKWIQKVQN